MVDPANEQGRSMKILVAYDGSRHADRMLDQLVDRLAWLREPPESGGAYVHVPLPYPGTVAVIGEEAVASYYSDECRAVLDNAHAILEERHVPHHTLALIGDPASMLVHTARCGRFDLVATGTHG